MIAGTKEIVVTMVFSVPPGVAPEIAVQMIQQNGISVAMGLMPHAKTGNVEIRDAVAVPGLKLS